MEDALSTPLRTLARRWRDVQVLRGDATVFAMLASAVVFLLGVEAASGVLLALYYRPGVAEANRSVRFMMTDVAHGSLVRAVHFWAGNLLILALGVTVAWAVLRRAYRSPNALAWFCGIALAFVAVLEAATGTLLPWTRRSVVDAEISSTLAGHLPLVGPAVRNLMLGGAEPGDLALVRILGVHAGALPMIATLLVAVLSLHSAGVVSAVRTVPARDVAPQQTISVEALCLRGAMVCAALAEVLLVLSSLCPPPLGPSAEVARASAEGLHPSWYLAFVHAIVAAAPARMFGIESVRCIAAALGLAFAALALFPAVDRKASRAGQAVVLVVLAAIAGGTLHALLR